MSNLDMIKNTGAPVSVDGGGTAALTGMKTKFSFMCLKCQTKYETAKEYAMTDNIAKTALKQQASSGISSILYNLLGRIPFIGYLLSGIASSAVSSAVSSTGGSQFEKAKKEAFEELKNNFMACSKCGQYGCGSCIKDGICKSCQQS